ncbi:MAG: phosphate/phosphite/phosphonate ABC transporter substrate-binding protein [Ilumatobacter sp.]
MISYLAPGYPEALFEALAARIGAEIRFEVGRSGPDPLDDPFATGAADVGWVCSTSFVELTTDRPASVREVGVAWVPDDPDAADRPVYFSDVVVGAGSDVTCLADLSGARIGCNDPASLSGFHALRIEIRRRGLDVSTFATLEMTGGHHRSIDRLLAGELDAAVIDSVVRTHRMRHDPDARALRVVERLGPWPTQPVVVHAGADDETVSEIREALLAANDDPDVRRLLAESALTRLAPTSVDHCTEVRAAMTRFSRPNTH